MKNIRFQLKWFGSSPEVKFKNMGNLVNYELRPQKMEYSLDAFEIKVKTIAM